MIKKFPLIKKCPFCQTVMNQVVENDKTPTRVWLDVQHVKNMKHNNPITMGPHADLGIYLCPECNFFALFLDGENKNG